MDPKRVFSNIFLNQSDILYDASQVGEKSISVSSPASRASDNDFSPYNMLKTPPKANLDYQDI